MIAFVRNLVFHDFWLKLLSLVFAVLIWLTVTFAQTDGGRSFLLKPNMDEKTYYNVPVLAILPAADIREVEVDPGEIQVTLQGESKLLQKLKPTDIRAQVDLTGIESARGLHKRIEIILPPGITYTRLVPDEVQVKVPPRK
jgi:YbbR domain-containing protein